MNNKVLNFVNKNKEKEVKRLSKLLFFFKNKELNMSNPLLKDWICVRNQIKTLERKLKETNETIY